MKTSWSSLIPALHLCLSWSIILYLTSKPNSKREVPPCPPWGRAHSAASWWHHSTHACKLAHHKAFASDLTARRVPRTLAPATRSLRAAFWLRWRISICLDAAKSVCSSTFSPSLPGGQHAEDPQITYLAVQHQWKPQCSFQHKQAALIRLESGASLWSVPVQWPALPEEARASHSRWAFQTPSAEPLRALRKTQCWCFAAVWVSTLTLQEDAWAWVLKWNPRTSPMSLNPRRAPGAVCSCPK